MSTASVIDEPLYEVVNGVRVETPRMGSRATMLANYLSQQINEFAMPQGLGMAMIEVLFELNASGLQRRPDIAFVSTQRWTPDMDGPDDPNAFKTVPDLAVEVVSPSNTVTEVQDKLTDYFNSGVRSVWIVHPKQNRIEVFDSLTASRILSLSDSLEGGAVLPGFLLPVSDVFTLPRRRQRP